MDEFEEKLKALRLAEPSGEMEQRVDAAFLAAIERTRRKPRRPRSWWWFVALASAGGLAAVLSVAPLHSRREAIPSETVYRFEAQGLMREMLLNSSSRQPEAPHFDIHVREP